MWKSNTDKWQDEVEKMIDECYKKYIDGLCVYEKDAGYIGYGKIAKYIRRYISRPVIAESRIIKHDNKEATYYYERHEDGKRIEETLVIEEFIKKVIRHVPDRQFKMIRHYGAHARVKSKKIRKIKEKSLYAVTNEKKK